ncbi:MAG: hypothetical protein BWY13_00820 [Euryarchaeota archaeon ADurb.Bin190]|nr:MAG: hypothetical protein BWY13_00820 [Euryarchaeota archaeon ADurb.Bin190]
MVQLYSIKSLLNQKAGDGHVICADGDACVPAAGPDDGTISHKGKALFHCNFIVKAGRNLKSIAAGGGIDCRLQIGAHLQRRSICQGGYEQGSQQYAIDHISQEIHLPSSCSEVNKSNVIAGRI